MYVQLLSYSQTSRSSVLRSNLRRRRRVYGLLLKVGAIAWLSTVPFEVRRPTTQWTRTHHDLDLQENDLSHWVYPITSHSGCSALVSKDLS